MHGPTLITGIYSRQLAESKLPLPEEVRRIEQRTKRDCLRCCVAMVTGKSHEEVPDFANTSSSWTLTLRQWLHKLGLTFVMVGREIAEVPPRSCCIEIGLSAPGYFHALVVAVDRLDPDPLRRGFVQPAKYQLVILPLARESDQWNNHAN